MTTTADLDARRVDRIDNLACGVFWYSTWLLIVDTLGGAPATTIWVFAVILAHTAHRVSKEPTT